jgi:Flp pilus assembly protein CpaB
MSHWHTRAGLAAISFAVALVCAGVLALLVRDRWQAPEIKTAEQARYGTTGQTAQSVGARVLPTDPKLTVEPAPAGPKQPANPN